MIGNGCARGLTFHYSTVFEWIRKIGCWTKRTKVYAVMGNDEEICIITGKEIWVGKCSDKHCKYGVWTWTKYVHGESLINQRYLVEHTAIIHESEPRLTGLSTSISIEA